VHWLLREPEGQRGLSAGYLLQHATNLLTAALNAQQAAGGLQGAATGGQRCGCRLAVLPLCRKMAALPLLQSFQPENPAPGHTPSLSHPACLQPCHIWHPAGRACVRRHRAACQPAWTPLFVQLPWRSPRLQPHTICRPVSSKRQQALAPVLGGCARPGEGRLCECLVPPWKGPAGRGHALGKLRCAAAPFSSLCSLCVATGLATAAGGQGCLQGEADRADPSYQLSAGGGAAPRLRWPAGGPAAGGWSGERRGPLAHSSSAALATLAHSY
jgi:hypothetical protein